MFAHSRHLKGLVAGVAEFGANPFAVGVDGAAGKVQRSGDFLGGPALSEQLVYLLLPFAQREGRGATRNCGDGLLHLQQRAGGGGKILDGALVNLLALLSGNP